METKTIIYIIVIAAFFGIPIGYSIGKAIGKAFLKSIGKGIESGMEKAFNESMKFDVNLKRTLFLFNVPICTGVGTYRLRETSGQEARQLWHNWNGEKISAIGHEATAEAIGVILKDKISINRINAKMKPGDLAIVLKMKGRIPEGTVLNSVEEMEKIGFDLLILSMEY